jgi:hypothetical protein
MFTVAVEGSPLNSIGALVFPVKIDFSTLMSYDQISTLEWGWQADDERSDLVL